MSELPRIGMVENIAVAFAQVNLVSGPYVRIFLIEKRTKEKRFGIQFSLMAQDPIQKNKNGRG